MRIYGYVERGLGKSECQDRVLIGDTILAGGFLAVDRLELTNLLVAVADGVGGYPGGERASLIAVDGIRVLNRRTKLIESDIRNLIENINQQILGTAQAIPLFANMATTLTALVFAQDTAVTVHVGNCRLCSYKKYLQAITDDQTLVAEMVRQGEITSEEAKTSAIRNRISACLGAGKKENASSLKVENQERLLHQESNFFMTSDGIHDYLEETDLEELLASDTDAETVCRKIAAKARANGSTDDISIVIVDRLGKYQ